MEREFPINDGSELAALVEQAVGGEDVVLTRGGREIARIVATPEARASAALARLKELRKGMTLGPDLTIRELIEEGRKY